MTFENLNLKKTTSSNKSIHLLGCLSSGSGIISIYHTKSKMYGHKQILQCLAVALILAVFNFHRAAIKRSKSITKPKIRRPGEMPSKMSKMEIIDPIVITNHNLTGYCIRYPFGHNIYGNYDVNYVCHSICFDKYATWLRQQCAAHCCISKANIRNRRGKNMRKSQGNRGIEQGIEPRNCRNTFKEYVENSAGLSNGHNEHMKTIIEPIHENLMSSNGNELTNQYECEIQTKDELICENTTSVSTRLETRLIKLETNYTPSIMDYHDFLFDASQPKKLPSNAIGM